MKYRIIIKPDLKGDEYIPQVKHVLWWTIGKDHDHSHGEKRRSYQEARDVIELHRKKEVLASFEKLIIEE